MRAKKKDESVFRLLISERDRCQSVVERINNALDRLPKGSLSQRKVKSGGKEYCYPCLRYRSGSRVLFEHLSPEKAEALLPLLEKRKKLESDMKANKLRIATINSLLVKE